MKSFVAAAALLLVSAAAFAAEPTAPSGDAKHGKQLFYAHGCYGCHGFNGETGARDLVGTNSPLVADLATFSMFLRQRGDLAPMLPSSRMPNYPATALSDGDVRDIYTFVRTFRLDAPTVSSVPTLKAILDSASRPLK